MSDRILHGYPYYHDPVNLGSYVYYRGELDKTNWTEPAHVGYEYYSPYDGAVPIVFIRTQLGFIADDCWTQSTTKYCAALYSRDSDRQEALSVMSTELKNIVRLGLARGEANDHLVHKLSGGALSGHFFRSREIVYDAKQAALANARLCRLHADCRMHAGVARDCKARQLEQKETT